MMKLIVIATILFHLAKGASIMDISCPDSCTCEIKEEEFASSCVNYEFIKKILPKQKTNIVRLNINNVSLSTIDLKLKYLKNLHVLDLSHNSIQSVPTQFPYLPKLRDLDLSHNKLNEVSFAQLPKNLNKIDLTFNEITHFPKDWSALKELQSVNFANNPIDCDCDNLAVYQELKFLLKENLTCHTPPELSGHHLDSINCSLIKEKLLNAMLGDEAGSTSEDDPENLEEEQEFFKADEVTVKEDENLEEGSGDEGSGFEPLFIPPCHFNCSTPAPIGLHDDKNDLAPPKFPDDVKTIFQDILQPEKVTTEAPVVKKEEPVVFKETDKVTEIVETVSTNTTDDSTLGKMERASLASDGSNSVYIVVGLVIAFVALLIIYYINKKKNQKKQNRKRNKSNENGFGEEMKPLGKSAEPVQLNDTKPPIVESAPLLNGQNGKINGDTPLKIEEDDESIESYSLTPQPERVTVKAGEIVDAIPKTPVVVHRQINSKGDIIVTTKSLT